MRILSYKSAIVKLQLGGSRTKSRIFAPVQRGTILKSGCNLLRGARQVSSREARFSTVALTLHERGGARCAPVARQSICAACAFPGDREPFSRPQHLQCQR